MARPVVNGSPAAIPVSASSWQGFLALLMASVAVGVWGIGDDGASRQWSGFGVSFWVCAAFFMVGMQVCLIHLCNGRSRFAAFSEKECRKITSHAVHGRFSSPFAVQTEGLASTRAAEARPTLQGTSTLPAIADLATVFFGVRPDRKPRQISQFGLPQTDKEILSAFSAARFGF